MFPAVGGTGTLQILQLVSEIAYVTVKRSVAMGVYLRTLADLLIDADNDGELAYCIQHAEGDELAADLDYISRDYRRDFPDIASLAETLHTILLAS
jgi:hypothetical protein